MSVFLERAALLEDLEFKLGPVRGRLAALLDILSDVEVGVGAHTAYCQAAKHAARPPRDLREALRQVGHAKELAAALLNAAGDSKPRAP